jgi:hypothetical protein
MTGGHRVPAKELPLAKIATAIPRLRVNHSEVSASSGAKVAELPTPIRPWMRANCQRLVAWLAVTNPSPRALAPTMTGTTIPKRSESLPIRMPLKAKPTMVKV